MHHTFDVIIVGSGGSGLYAALEVSRKAKTAVLSRIYPIRSHNKTKRMIRVSEKNRSAIMRRILVRMQGASASAYLWICANGCNAADGPKDKQDGGFIFSRGPKVPQRISAGPLIAETSL